MTIKLGWSPLPDENFGFGESGGSWNSPFEVERVGFGIGFMIEKIKENIFVFKIKYEDELGSKKIWQPFLNNGARNACWYFLTHTEIIHKRTEVPL